MATVVDPWHKAIPKRSEENDWHLKGFNVVFMAEAFFGDEEIAPKTKQPIEAKQFWPFFSSSITFERGLHGAWGVAFHKQMQRGVEDLSEIHFLPRKTWVNIHL